MPEKKKYALNRDGTDGAGNTDLPLDINRLARGGENMPDLRHYSDSAPVRNREQSKHRETPGSHHWKLAVIRDLKAGYGAEDIAHRMECRTAQVRDLIGHLRTLGFLDQIYREARKEWGASA